MKSHSIAASFSLLCLMLPAVADTFILKDGSKLEGSIIRQDATSYVVEVKVSKTIKDEKVIAKADVAKIEKTDPEISAFEEIEKLVPTPDLLSKEEYDQRIRLAEKYLVDYRGSAKTKEAKAIIATLKSEAGEILAGGIKLKGKIVSSGEYRANAYEIDARIMETKIRALVENSQYLSALRMFSEFDRDFRNTTAHASLLPLIQQVVTAYLDEINNLLSTFDARAKQRQIGLDLMPSTERRRTEGAIRDEEAQFEKQLKEEKDAKVVWVTVHPLFKPSLADTLNFGKSEQSRLLSLKTGSPVDGGKAFRDAYNLIQSKGDSKAVPAAISAAKSALVAPRYIAKLEAASQSNGTNH